MTNFQLNREKRVQLDNVTTTLYLDILSLGMVVMVSQCNRFYDMWEANSYNLQIYIYTIVR